VENLPPTPFPKSNQKAKPNQSLVNTGQPLLIKRIMHHLYKTDALNRNQFGFTPQKNTVDAAMEVRQFIEPH